MKHIERQGTAPVGALLWQYSLPAVAGFVGSALYQLVDRVIDGLKQAKAETIFLLSSAEAVDEGGAGAGGGQ